MYRDFLNIFNILVKNTSIFGLPIVIWILLIHFKQ